MLPQIGKIDTASFDQFILPRLGRKDSSVLIGPKHGVDAAVIELSENQVMVIAEDPTFGLPVLLPYFGWGIVHICASDVAVLGVQPRYMTICLMFPPQTDERTLDMIWGQIHDECEKLGIAIIGGHTGIYPGISYPLNGGCTVIGLGTKSQLTPSSNAKIGDKIIMTKGPAIEATGILAMQAEKSLVQSLGQDIVSRAKKLFFEMSVVKDALIAAPNAHAMHDATEGGLINCVYEIATASNVGFRLFEDRIIISEEISAVCNYFGIDPLISISEGTLVLTASPEKAQIIINDLAKNDIQAWEIGEITKSEKTLLRKNGKKEDVMPVKVDPFWSAYFSVLEEK